MAAAPFDVLVWTKGPAGSAELAVFPVAAERAAFTAIVLKGWIERSRSGEKAGFTAIDWDLYLASETGQKGEGPLAPGRHFTPAAGSIVHVRVEPKPGAAAGEPWGPGSWAGGGLGAGLG